MIPPPRPCPGLEPYTPSTAVRLTRWVIRHQLTKPPITALAIATALTIAAVAWPLGFGTAALLALLGTGVLFLAVAAITASMHLLTVRRWERDGWMIGYFTKDASQLVHLENGAWMMSEHHARRRGQGFGKQLRAVVWPHLEREADRAGVVIRTATKVPALAGMYLREMTGLQIEDESGGVISLVRLPVKVPNRRVVAWASECSSRKNCDQGQRRSVCWELRRAAASQSEDPTHRSK